METTHYFSYLMRIWQGDDLPCQSWQASLEDPSTNKVMYFKLLDEMFAYLRAAACEDQNCTTRN